MLLDQAEDFNVEAAKALLKETLDVVSPKPLSELYIPPADCQAWNRFRTSMGTFFDIVTDEMVTMEDRDSLLLKINEQKEDMQALEKEMEEMREYKKRFEALEKDAGPDYLKTIASK